MKYIFTIFLLIVVGLAFSQEYYFDRLIQYEENGENKIQLLYNSQSTDNFLYLMDKPEGASADLYDKKANKIHHFDVSKPQENNGIIYNYIYSSSDKLLPSQPNDNLTYEFKTKRDDEYYRFADLNIYTTDKTDKPYITADLTLRYTHESKFDAFNSCCLLGSDFAEIIKPDDKFVVVRAKITDQLGEKHEYKLISDQVIQFMLNVPEKKKK